MQVILKYKLKCFFLEGDVFGTGVAMLSGICLLPREHTQVVSRDRREKDNVSELLL
ncbi:MAG: hypothetical protein ACI8V2_003067 [Candidatus Latescibacterota bacterium]|jgi:hypothetical protein